MNYDKRYTGSVAFYKPWRGRLDKNFLFAFHRSGVYYTAVANYNVVYSNRVDNAAIRKNTRLQKSMN